MILRYKKGIDEKSMLESKSVCHQGKVRERNEDSCVASETLGLWLIADGVGGNGNGDVASQLATQTIERKIRQGSELASAITGANTAIEQAIESDESLSNMATTIVACRFDHHRFELAWVGDSRAYLIDASGISQISSDHNLAASLYERGELTREQANRHSGQHELTQALGQMTLNNVPISLGELHDGDFLLLCTDGLSGVLSDQQLYQIIHQADSIEVACERLLQRVLESGAPDNVTFSLIQYRNDEAPIEASDFKTRSFRLPFDRTPYMAHSKSRPMLLVIILISIVSMLLFI